MPTFEEREPRESDILDGTFSGLMVCVVKRFEWSIRLESFFMNTVHLPFNECKLISISENRQTQG